jgi:hypothetical protein
VSRRQAVLGVGTSLISHIEGKLQKVPAVKGKSVMQLADVIGAQASAEIQASGSISFHSVGDTGKSANSPQGDVAEAMATDFDTSKPQTASPAFFFHLGCDVIYGPGKDNAYRGEFYEPYVHYPGKIIAIPGNHDGEVFPKTDPKTLEAFQANFCAPSQKVPPIAGTIYRETMNQPGVYWWLSAPFVDIVGLYSNAAENPEIFRITPAELTTLYSFPCDANLVSPNGQYLITSVTFGSNGNLFGAPNYGGTYQTGTLFELACSGTVTVLYDFDLNQNLFGTNAGSGYMAGSILSRVTESGKVSRVHTFCKSIAPTVKPRLPGSSRLPTATCTERLPRAEAKSRGRCTRRPCLAP